MKSAGACCRCKTDMWIPDPLYESANRSSKISFWCSYGHEQHFVTGESDATKLRRERDLLAQRIAQKDDEILFQKTLREAAERSAAAQRGIVTKLKKRAANGACPCCNRSFVNLHRHMATKHPDYTKEEEFAS